MDSIKPENALLDFTLQWADTSLVLGQRIAEWCGHGPILEQDIALSNIALDFVGEARSLYQYAAKLEDEGRTEDDLAFFRDERAFKNLLLAEQTNGDFAKTVLRLFFYEAFHLSWLKELAGYPDETFSAIAQKSAKEAKYHFQWSAEWVIRLGDGTEESKQRMEKAVDELWRYTGEMFLPAPHERVLIQAGKLPALDQFEKEWQRQVCDVFGQATLPDPNFDAWMQSGGKEGLHTEHLGYLLAEMQVLQRTYPGNQW